MLLTSGSGQALLDLVAVVDRLRRECPWDRAQTHRSLARHLLEESYETLEAIDAGDSDSLREELGDLLLQVVLHARIGAEDPSEPWDLDDVAAGIVAKLVRRHPHVFAGAQVSGVEDVAASWELLKATEKDRSSVVDGVPAALPALARADKLLDRLQRSGLDVAPVESDSLGARLLGQVAKARADGLDPEAELRATLSELTVRIRAAEAAGSPPPSG